MAKKTIYYCDFCGKEVAFDDLTKSKLTHENHKPRKGGLELWIDFCENCGKGLDDSIESIFVNHPHFQKKRDH